MRNKCPISLTVLVLFVVVAVIMSINAVRFACVTQITMCDLLYLPTVWLTKNHWLFLCFQFSVVYLTTSFRLFQPCCIWTNWPLVWVRSGCLWCWTWACPLRICTGAVLTTPSQFRVRCSRDWWCGRRGTEEKPQWGGCSRACRPQTSRHLSSNRCLCDVMDPVFLDFTKLLLSCGKHTTDPKGRETDSVLVTFIFC